MNSDLFVTSAKQCAPFVLVTLLFTLPISHALADGGVRTIALTGRHAPATEDGAAFETLGLPSLNIHGQVAFASDLTGASITLFNSRAMWLHSPGAALEMLARSGQQAPDTLEGIHFLHFDFVTPPQLNDAGEVGATILLHDSTGAMRINNQDHGTTNYGYWLWEPAAGLKTIVVGGEHTPSSNHFFRGFGFFETNNLGQHVHGATPLPIPPGGVADFVRAESLWLLGPDAAPRLIAGKGAQAPGLPGGVVFRWEDELGGFTAARSNSLGQVVFGMQVSGPGVSTSNDQGYWIDDGLGGVALLIRERDQAPGLSSGVTLGSVFVTGFSDAGHVVLFGTLQGPGVNSSNNVARWSNAAGHGLELLVREGDHAPGTASDVLFDFINSAADFNNAGQYAFAASLRGISVDNGHRSGIWSQGGGNALELVIREGDPAPGTAAGVVFDDSLSPDFPELPNITFNMSLNDSGQLAFDGYLRGPGITSANNSGIWAQDREGNLQLIVRTGDLLDVDDGPNVDWRTIQFLELGQDFLNDRGQIAFRATFTDGSHGIFISNLVAVPEPSSIGLAVVCMFIMWRPRARAGGVPTILPYAGLVRSKRTSSGPYATLSGRESV